MKKLTFFFGILFIFISISFGLIKAIETEQNIIYLYSSKNYLKQDIIKDLENDGMTIDKIKVDDLDNLKYFYLYQAAYNMPSEEFTEPIIISGENYYIGKENIVNNLEAIKIKAQEKIKSIKDVNIKMIVYFKSTFCQDCQQIEADILALEAQGIKVVWINTADGNNDNRDSQLLLNYGEAYGVKEPTVPLVFAGDKYYHTGAVITKNIAEISLNSANSLIDVEFKEVDISKFHGLMGFVFVIIGGLIDGFNPCAMAILILFIGMLIGTKAKKSILINISIAYILGLFVTYFALGLFLMEFIGYIEPYISNLATYINVFIIAFSLFFFVFNLYDYYVTKRKDYKKVKNQLPKRIQKFNKKIINFFSHKINDKNIFVVYLFSFLLAVIITFTEFLCTGQVYLPIILMIKESSVVEGTIKLLVYNIMFVLPLIVLAIITIKARSAMETSNIIREKLHIIKLITSFLFLGIALYYILVVIGVV